MGDQMTRASLRKQQGLTLVEIAVVLTVAAILYMQAAPMFSVWLGNTQTRTAAESILNGLQLARGEAIRRNRLVQLVFTNGAEPSWTVGCANPVDTGTPDVDDAGDCLPVIQARGAGEASVQPQLAMLPIDATTITFDSLGRVTANIDGSVTATQINVANPIVGDADRRTLRLALGAAGDVRMCDPAVVASDPRGC
ncbi:MAG: GspH/FimT family pseudopilin [Burkholderiaceae bacterium]